MRQKRILIVDDDPDVVSLLKRTLEQAHFGCSSASSVAQALESMETLNPDLVILDLGFTQASGNAFLQHTKEWGKQGRQVPPVIVLSGYSDKEIVDYALNMGAASFVAKPYELNTLLTIVNEHTR